MTDIDESMEDSALTRQQLTVYASGLFTKQSVDLYEKYSLIMDKNDALGMVIEALSISLGNVISLVGEEHQQEVIDSANEVIQQGLVDQMELIAEIAYGIVGHA